MRHRRPPAKRPFRLAALLIPAMLAPPVHAAGGGGGGSAAATGSGAAVAPLPRRAPAATLFGQPGLTTISRSGSTIVSSNGSGGGATTTTNRFFSVNGRELSVSRNASRRVTTDAAGRVVSSSQSAFATIDRGGPVPADITTTPTAIVAAPSGEVTVVSRASVAGPFGQRDIGTVVDRGAAAARSGNQAAGVAARRSPPPPSSRRLFDAGAVAGPVIRNPAPAASFVDANGNSAVFSTVIVR
jgi:hypothetical protein